MLQLHSGKCQKLQLKIFLLFKLVIHKEIYKCHVFPGQQLHISTRDISPGEKHNYFLPFCFFHLRLHIYTKDFELCRASTLLQVFQLIFLHTYFPFFLYKSLSFLIFWQIDIFVRKMNSIPAFTANLTVESFNKRTLS